MVLRATIGGEITCEGCGLILTGKPFEFDHTIPEALVLDKSRPLTIEDGKLLGAKCCHEPKTNQEDKPRIAKAKRQRDKNTGVIKPKGKIKNGPSKPKAAGKKPSLPPRSLYMKG